MSAPEPLSAERRAEIERTAGFADSLTLSTAFADLLAEVDRLRAITEAAVEWYEAGGGGSHPDGRLHRANRNLRRVVRATALADPVRLPEPERRTCGRCNGEGCEEGCGTRGGCEMAYAGPDSHRICRTCNGRGTRAAAAEGAPRADDFSDALTSSSAPGSAVAPLPRRVDGAPASSPAGAPSKNAGDQ